MAAGSDEESSLETSGADSTGARGIFAPLLFKVGGQEYHFAPLLSGNFNNNLYQK